MDQSIVYFKYLSDKFFVSFSLHVVVRLYYLNLSYKLKATIVYFYAIVQVIDMGIVSFFNTNKLPGKVNLRYERLMNKPEQQHNFTQSINVLNIVWQRKFTELPSIRVIKFYVLIVVAKGKFLCRRRYGQRCSVCFGCCGRM